MSNKDFIQNYLSQVRRVTEIISVAEIELSSFFLRPGEMVGMPSPVVTAALPLLLPILPAIYPRQQS